MADTVKNSRKVHLYLDICVLCRPFDDQRAMRIHLETNAYYLILQAITDGIYEMDVSPVHIEEARAIPNTEERREIMALLEKLGTRIECQARAVKERAEYLHSKRFGLADAAHVAFAEVTSDYFITCDDRLLKKCKKTTLEVESMNPVTFVAKEDLK